MFETISNSPFVCTTDEEAEPQMSADQNSQLTPEFSSEKPN